MIIIETDTHTYSHLIQWNNYEHYCFLLLPILLKTWYNNWAISSTSNQFQLTNLFANEWSSSDYNTYLSSLCWPLRDFTQILIIVEYFDQCHKLLFLFYYDAANFIRLNSSLCDIRNDCIICKIHHFRRNVIFSCMWTTETLKFLQTNENIKCWCFQPFAFR